MSARRELVVAVAERYRTAKRDEKGGILDELTAVMAPEACGASAERE